MSDIIYDIETFKNYFCFVAYDCDTKTVDKFQISPIHDDYAPLCEWFSNRLHKGYRMVGYNNLTFDYVIMHDLITNKIPPTAEALYQAGQTIINSSYDFPRQIWDKDQLIPQVDLLKMNHYDNQARYTSLKELEARMRMNRIEELPYDPHMPMNQDQMAEVLEYCCDDVRATWLFYTKCKKIIQFREDFGKKMGKNIINFSDSKIGSTYFIDSLEKKNPGCCYDYSTGGKLIKQTPRNSINLGEVILPYISFEHPSLKHVHQTLANKTITETKGVFEDLRASVDGFDYIFGLGGIHGSVDRETFVTDINGQIIDCDVTSYYPNISIKNKIFPEHLGETFCEVYQDLFDERSLYPKKTHFEMNYGIKIALNATYGNSNNQYSPMYDPKFTMAITINGQLALCMLGEQLMKIPRLKMIQANTDGLTVKCPHEYIDHYYAVCEWWERLTNYNLEYCKYDKMAVRDVNNYVAVYEGGTGTKLKGAYSHDRGWHQNHSALVVPKVASHIIVHGGDPDELVRNHANKMDFMIHKKVRRVDEVYLRTSTYEEKLQRVNRYYVSNTGGSIVKIGPIPKGFTEGAWKIGRGVDKKTYDEWVCMCKERPNDGVAIDALGAHHNPEIHTKNKSKYKRGVSELESGQLVTVCNNLPKTVDINYDYYIKLVKKLLEVL